jgi:hypothetical protein
MSKIHWGRKKACEIFHIMLSFRRTQARHIARSRQHFFPNFVIINLNERESKLLFPPSQNKLLKFLFRLAHGWPNPPCDISYYFPCLHSGRGLCIALWVMWCSIYRIMANISMLDMHEFVNSNLPVEARKWHCHGSILWPAFSGRKPQFSYPKQPVTNRVPMYGELPNLQLNMLATLDYSLMMTNTFVSR